MIEQIVIILEKYGLPMLFLGITIFYLHGTVKHQRKERNDWREDHKVLTEKYDDRQKESNEVLRQLTAVIEHIQNNR